MKEQRTLMTFFEFQQKHQWSCGQRLSHEVKGNMYRAKCGVCGKAWQGEAENGVVKSADTIGIELG